MQTNVEGRLALARVRFEPVACMLDRLAEDIEKEHGQPAVLEQTGPMEPIAQNVCSVRYSLGYPDEARLALTFVVTGESADLLLLQAEEQSDPRVTEADVGPVDQHVYRVEEIDGIKQAVQEKIRAHLRTRSAQGPGRVTHILVCLVQGAPGLRLVHGRLSARGGNLGPVKTMGFRQPQEPEAEIHDDGNLRIGGA